MNLYFGILSLAALINLIGYLWLVVTGFKRSIVWGLLVLLFSPITAIFFALTNWFDARKPFLVYILSLLLGIGTVIFIYTEVGGANLQKLSLRLQTGEMTAEEASRLLEKALRQPGVDLFKEELPAQPDASTQPVAAPASTELTGGATGVETDKPVQEGTTEMIPAEPTTGAAEPAQAEAKDAGGTEQGAAQPAKPATPAYPTRDKVVPDPLAIPRKEPEADTIVISPDKVGQYLGRYLIIEMKNGSQQRGILTRVDDKSLLLHRKLYGGSMEYRVYTSQVKTVRVLKKGSEPRS